MVVLTDNKKGAEKVFSLSEEWIPEDCSAIDQNLVPLMRRMYGQRAVLRNVCRAPERWSYAFYVQNAASSHFDLLVEFSKSNLPLPNGILCVAGSGRRFHGQRGRPWAAQKGNIHLAVHLAPSRSINKYYAGLPVLSAVSIVQTIDALAGLEGQAKIKWVNDILVQGTKVAGFLVHTQTVQDRITAIILGVGLNVEKTPVVKTDVFTPKAGCLREFFSSYSAVTPKKIMKRLLESLDKNYGLLLEGQYRKLLDFYRKRSAVIGREVHIYSDIPGKEEMLLFSGTVEKIGDNLELCLKGQKNPVREGRLVLIPTKHEDST